MKRPLTCALGLHRSKFNVFSEHWHCELCMWMRGFRGRWLPPNADIIHDAAVKSFLAATPEDRAKLMAVLNNLADQKAAPGHGEGGS